MNLKRLFYLILVAAVLAGIGFGAYMYLSDREAPNLAMTPDSGAVNGKREITILATDKSGVRSLVVTALQDGKSVQLAELKTEPDQNGLEAVIDLGGTGFKDGKVEIIATATDGSIYAFGKGNTGRRNFELVLDTRPPNVAVQSGAHNLNQGGSGLVAYKASDDSIKTGVFVGDKFFPGYLQETGTYLAFFAFPYDMSVEEFEPVLVAIDAAGNQSEVGFRHHANARSFRDDVINISPRFLETKMPQFRDEFPEAETDLDVFLKVNNMLRKQNRAYHYELSQRSASEPLWEGAFLRLPNSARMAAFGDKRTYLYDGEEIDTQRHMGVDLASTKAAEVPAANWGRVVLAGEFGIYGQTVVIDHGLGLMTLYGHLRQIDVSEGDTVEKGQVVGRTGATGLAGGDHLHYGVYVAGHPVQPVEWWDPHWIEVNVADRLGM